MDEVKLTEDRPPNIYYEETGKLSVSLVFSWDNAGTVPSGVEVRVAEIARPNVYAQSTGPLKQTWSTFEDAEWEGRKFASELMKDWDNWVGSRQWS